MLSLEIHKDDVKIFMGKLLREGIFDTFESRMVEIVTTAMRVNIDGTKEEASAGYSKWETVRPLAYEFIKQTEKPKMLKIIFSKESPDEIHKNAAALFLNLVYENDGVIFTTACAQKEFAMDKTMDVEWDNYVRKFLAEAKVSVSDRV